MTMMSRKEAIKYLGISERTMCQLTANHEIAYHQRQRGGSMQFSQEDLDRYLESIRVPTRAERARSVVLPGGTTYRKRRAAV